MISLRRAPAWTCSVLTLALALAVSGCGALADRRPPAKRHGTVVFHDVAPRRATSSRSPQFSDTTMVFTSAEDDLADASNRSLRVRTSADTDRDNPTRDLGSRIGMGRNQIPPSFLTAEKFARLWRGLTEAGLFDLPRYPHAVPPTNESYFSLQSGDERWIFVRPPDMEVAREGTRGSIQREKWRDATIFLVLFSNS